MNELDKHHDEIQAAKEHLTTLSDHDFEIQYKATKRTYKAVLRSLEWLSEAVEVLEKPGLMDVDWDVLDTAKCCIEDFSRLLERMHMASYWKGEEQ
jgi:hypothetical protein